MKALSWIARALIILWGCSGALLAWSILQQWTPGVQAGYVAVIGMLILTLIVSATASLALAIGRFSFYWMSAYPLLLALLLLGYGVLKASPTLLVFALLAGVAVAGFLLAWRVLGKWQDFLPIACVAALLITGEIPGLPRSAKAATFIFAAGLMLGALARGRRRYESARQ